MIKFLEWVQQYNEGFMDCPQKSGDQVLFNVHNIDELKPPLDLSTMQDNMGMVQHTKGSNVFVSSPSKTRHRNMKKFMSKDGSGLLKLASGQLKEVPSEFVISNGDSKHKTYIYAPGEYHRGFLKRADKKMMAAEQPMTPDQADLPAQQALPAPTQQQMPSTRQSLPAPAQQQVKPNQQSFLVPNQQQMPPTQKINTQAQNRQNPYTV